MLHGKRTRRVVATTLLVVMLSNTIAPTVSYALTSGPTVPEATSFEPVDTTDMVNLQTGDFTYNIPLMEVPGPEGGYPLSLSYHAGIQTNEEASWVGLGWTLNPECKWISRRLVCAHQQQPCILVGWKHFYLQCRCQCRNC
jgi:hypothetical protein